MSKTLSISQPMSIGRAEAIDAINKVYEELGPRYNLVGEWNSETLFSLSGPGVEGHIQILSGSVEVALTLGGFLANFSQAVESAIRSQLQEKLG
jgi:putative polyhydroxyalkanoate system protein